MKFSQAQVRWFELSGGTFAGQAVMIISLPLITSNLGTAVFGQFVVLSSLAATITTFSTLRFELLLFRKLGYKDESLIYSAALIGFLFSLVLLPCVFYFLNFFTNKSNYLDVILVNWQSLCVNLFLLSLNNIFFYANLHRGENKKISISKITQPLVFILGVIFISKDIKSVSDLLYIDSFSRILFLLVNLSKSQITFFFEISQLKTSFKYFQQAPLLIYRNYKASGFLTLTSLLNAIAVQIPLALFSSRMSAHEFGVYAVVERLVHLPLGFVSTSIGQLYINAIRNNPNREYLNLKRISYVVLGPYILLSIFLGFFLPLPEGNIFYGVSIFLLLTPFYYSFEFIFFVFYQATLIYYPQQQLIFDIIRILILLLILVTVNFFDLNTPFVFFTLSVGWFVIVLICNQFFWKPRFKSSLRG
jgi:O-antigen/teichoic acid export membrane protein